jgi:photosystem II stability/assembly factor-like uncharacterized protein
MPTKTEIWSVGGGGHVGYDNIEGVSRKYNLANDEIYNGDLYGVYFNNSGSGWVVGDGGVIFHTSNRGKKWKLQHTGVKTKLRAITCTSEKHCWAVGDEGIILITSDEGESWERIKAGVSERLEAVEFIDSKIGWAVGDNGLVIRTQDGGRTWSVHRISNSCDPECGSGVPDSLKAVKFMNENFGWVAGYDGIARTGDGGDTWEIFNLESSREVAAIVGIVSHDGKKVWAVNRGHNYCSEDSGKIWKKCTSGAATPPTVVSVRATFNRCVAKS